MGRVGGYFPERMRNVLKTHKLAHPNKASRILSREEQVRGIRSAERIPGLIFSP